MKTLKKTALGFSLGMASLLPASLSLAGPPLGRPTPSESITGTVVRVQGANTLEVHAQDGKIHPVHFTSRYNQALQNGRRVPLQTLRSGQTVIVTGKVLNGSFWAEGIRVDSED